MFSPAATAMAEKLGLKLGRANLDEFAATLTELAQADRNVIAVTSDSRGSGKLNAFGQLLPQQLVEVGVAEQNLVGITAGLAAAGKQAFAASPASFLTARSLEQIKNDVCYSDVPARLVGISAGVSYGALGSTHHSLHDLAALRAIPNLITLRPADANEVREAWKIAIANRHRPSALVLTRQNLPTLDRTVYAPAEDTQRGAYVLKDLGTGKPRIILMASGSEVALIVEAGKRLADEGVAVRLVSFPSWELFGEQEAAYQASVLPPDITARVAVEAGVTMGWHRWVGTQGRVLGVDRFGASAPAKTVFEKLGLTVDNTVKIAKELL